MTGTVARCAKSRRSIRRDLSQRTPWRELGPCDSRPAPERCASRASAVRAGRASVVQAAPDRSDDQSGALAPHLAQH